MDEDAKPNTSEEAAAAVATATTAAAETASSPMPPAGPEPPAEEEDVGDLVERVAELVDEIAAISDFRNAYRRQFCNLSRRIRLLAPMMEEAKEGPRPLLEPSVAALRLLRDALAGAKELLRLGSGGSKIFLVGLLNLLVCFTVLCLRTAS
jgi:hypothetical protein